jgi:hypothetical protein
MILATPEGAVLQHHQRRPPPAGGEESREWDQMATIIHSVLHEQG